MLYNKVFYAGIFLSKIALVLPLKTIQLNINFHKFIYIFLRRKILRVFYFKTFANKFVSATKISTHKN